MGEIAESFGDAFRDFATDGVPASGANKPSKAEIRAAANLIETALASAGTSITRYATAAARNADTTKPSGSLAYVYANNGSTTDGANGFYQWNGSAWVAAPWFFSGANAAAIAAAAAALAPVKEDSGATILAATLLAGGAVAVPINGNPNELRVVVPNATNQTPFDIFIIATPNAGDIFLTPSSGTRLRMSNGGGVPLVALDLPKGKLANVVYSTGGAWVLNNTRDLTGSDKLPKYDTDLTAKPWGNVTFSGSTRTVAAIDKYIVVCGSSNANADYVGAAQLPSNVVVAALNDAFPGGALNFIPDNRAQAGAPLVTISSQLGGSTPYQAGGQVPFVLTFYGMNDARTLFYHDNGGIMAEIAALRAAIVAIRTKGSEPVLNTIFPPDPRASTVALDPNYYADTSAYPAGGSSRGMDYPASKASPVSPENHMEPRLSQVLTGPRDWTGSGVLRQGYKRIWHVNEMVRSLAAEFNCMLLDIEFCTYRNAIETVPDLGSGLDTFYDQTNPLHPKDALYAAGVSPVLKEWARYVATGRRDQRVFRGVA